MFGTPWTTPIAGGWLSICIRISNSCGANFGRLHSPARIARIATVPVCTQTLTSAFTPGSESAEEFAGGIVHIVSGLKTVIETGEPLGVR
jgi:hypothetical protein